MFNGNKLVLILPGILIIVMLVGGYYFLQGTEPITNEELKERIVLDSNVIATDEGLRIRANWDWTLMPAEGLYGEDYIGVAIEDKETGENRTDVEVVEAKLELLYLDHVIAEESGEVVENGIIFSYANQLVEHESHGNLGRIDVRLIGENLSVEDVSIRMLHTWTDHSPLDKVDATFAQPTFPNAANVPYWIAEFE